ncbi:hypothetical protein AB751O23_DD_00010 [Chlamydiales bacterium SCGC AB-751-O23]|nr:hypothetical protein AB751O23_DD_00010 [Chlamydiales bacterium SCGC AB-751-O23]
MSQHLKHIHHIPYINFEGVPELGQKDNALIFKHMNLPIGKIVNYFTPSEKSFVNLQGRWVEEEVDTNEDSAQYQNFWGIKNYGQVRLIAPARFKEKTHSDMNLTLDPQAQLYLEIAHSPKLSIDTSSATPLLKTQKSYLPLHEKHIQALMQHMYTVRFFVQNQKAYRYHLEKAFKSPEIKEVPLKGLKDGLYEFYYGKAYSIDQGWKSFLSGGKRSLLPLDHSIYDTRPSRVLSLFNEGIAFGANSTELRNSRYAFFRNGDFCLLGEKIFDKEDPVLKNFVQKEQMKVDLGQRAFIDHGSPIKDGKINKELLERHGYKVPQGHYLLLGDNHAQSSDSRDFGAVPFSHVRGSPSFRLWPFDDRFGFPNQPDSSSKSPTLFVWIFAFISGLMLYMLHVKAVYADRFKKMSSK